MTHIKIVKFTADLALSMLYVISLNPNSQYVLMVANVNLVIRKFQGFCGPWGKIVRGANVRLTVLNLAYLTYALLPLPLLMLTGFGEFAT